MAAIFAGNVAKRAKNLYLTFRAPDAFAVLKNRLRIIYQILVKC